ncbi:hypothetical protein KAR91_75135 [Candidatus Pacearchaeota archaeon]|nr:hypothetical protein [Candidatus Pacearchaeota archaeon]
MIITAHKGQDDERMEKIIGTSPYVTAVGTNVPDGFVLYAKDGDVKRYSVMAVSEYEKAKFIQKEMSN